MKQELVLPGIKPAPLPEPKSTGWGLTRKLLLALLLLAPLGFYPFLREAKERIIEEKEKPIPPPALTPDQRLVLGTFMSFPGAPFPSALAWEPLFKIGQQESRAFEELAASDPVEFLQRCLDRCDKEVTGYRCVFLKQERVKGKLLHEERIRIHFRNTPFSVHMDWLKSKGIIPIRTLYVANENDGLMVVRPFHDLLPVKHVKVDHPDAQNTSRFDITNFGMHVGARNTLNSMRKAQENGTLYVTYEGIVKVKEVGDRLCYKFIRAPHVPTEDDDVNEITIYIDLETHLQVGSVLLNSKGELLAEYFFRDIQLNPPFKATQFTLKAL